MPNPTQILIAVATAATVAAALLLLCAWPWRAPAQKRLALGWTTSVAFGFYAGCWLLDLRPKWPPFEDTHRLLAIVFPGAVLVEWLAVFLPTPPVLRGTGVGGEGVWL